MDGGIHTDQNFYDRRANHHSPEHHQQQLYQRTYEPPPLPDFEVQSPQVPPKLPFLTTQNLQAVAASSGYGSGRLNGEVDREPDDYYRGVHQASHSFENFAPTNMASTISDSRPQPSSLRSNGNGTTPKHPTLPVARTAPKQPSYRSVSSPLDDRAGLGNAKPTGPLNGNSRVKEMLKRFDQNNEQPSLGSNKPAPRINTRDVSGPGYMKDRVGNTARSSNSSSPASSTRGPGSVTRDNGSFKKSSTQPRPTQRARFTPEDQHSNNALSTSSRTSNPRTAAGTISLASKSMSNLSPTSSEASSVTQRRQPLFGEITPVGQGGSNVGYGIPQTPVRRTSTSSLQPGHHPHQPTHRRSRSNLDHSPSSPTALAWYLGYNPSGDDSDPNKAKESAAHNRSHSDFADAKANPMVPTNHSPIQASAHSGSRIPLPSRLSNSSDSPSLPSSRGNSPPTITRQLTNGKPRRADPRPWSPANHAVAPVSREKTVTPTRSPPRRKTRSPEKLTPAGAPLKAYISSPPPKSSPPLRSSRPRQPVSSASTNSSRQKAVDRSGSPHVKSGMRITRNPEAHEPKSRKIPDVPLSKVDFKERRERIQRAYTKSIHEHEQKDIRAANLKRLKEREQQAREASAAASAEDPIPPMPKEAPPKVEIQPPSKVNTPVSPPLYIKTSFQQIESLRREEPVHNEDQDSPTLGMPGTFVDDDEPPQSAISNATGVTEIENEPQTEAGLSRAISVKHLAPGGFSSHVAYLDDQLSPEQALFGMQYLGADSPVEDEESSKESIHIMLDAGSVEEAQPESTPTNDEFNKESTKPLISTPEIPGAFHEDEESAHPVFTATVISASPEEAIPINFLAKSLPQSTEQHQTTSNKTEHRFDEHISEQPQPQSQSTPEIAFPDEIDRSHTPDPTNGPSFTLPMLHTALAPGSTASGEGASYLNTPVTDIEYESSDGLALADASEQENHDDEQNHSSAEPNRSSHVSSWTNYSVESIDGQYENEDYSRSSIATSSDPEKKPTPPPKEVSPAPPPKPDGYSPQPSPRFQPVIPLLSSPLRHQLPPLAIGDGFGLGLDRNPVFGSSAVPLWAPDYSPPPPPPLPQADDEAPPVQPTRTPPPTSIYNKRPPSSLYQSSQNGAGQNNEYESRRASDDFYSPRASSSTPRSSTQISLTESTPDTAVKPSLPEVYLTEEEKKAAEKEAKRLTRRRNVIKELIDTESVYLKDMNVVEEIYKGTAEACPKLDANDIKIIFRNTEEIIAFTTVFLDELKVAAASIYSPRSQKSRQRRTTTTSTTGSSISPTDDRLSIAATLADETDDQKDKKTFVGTNFGKHLTQMQVIYTEYLKNSEVASTRLATLNKDPAVKVWLTECNHVAKDITQAWDLDALLVKPVQRLTRYPLLLKEINEMTPENHPDHGALIQAHAEVTGVLRNIEEMKTRIQLVGKIVGRKRKESDARTGLQKILAKRANKMQSSNPNRPQDDESYLKAKERFGDDFLKLQVVLRDFQLYQGQIEQFSNDWLRQLSSMELVMRMSATPYPEIESKWARFNMSMRDIGTVVLESHKSSIEKKVIEPLEQIIALYTPPNLAMKKRTKRRLDYEKYLALKSSSKKIDEKLAESVTQYEALNETLKLELPALSAKTHLLGNLVISQFVQIQIAWWDIWQQKVRVVLEDSQLAKDVPQIVEMFHRDYKYTEARIHELGIINGSFGAGAFDRSSTRDSQSTQDDDLSKVKSRPSNLSGRSRGVSINSDKSPSLPTPDFAKRLSGQFTFSPIVATAPGLPSNFSYPSPFSNGHSRNGSGSPATPDTNTSRPSVQTLGRPNTGRSHTSERDSGLRMSTEYNTGYRRESGSTYNSHQVDERGPPPSSRPYSGLFHSAMPMNDGLEDSARSSRASSRDRGGSEGFNVLYLAASLFEFNISATKTEAGYPYLTYQAGEIFDVIGEKGELWLAKNQDDPTNQVGWIWSKHFARLASD